MKENRDQGRTVLCVGYGSVGEETVLRNRVLNNRTWDIEFKYPEFGTVGNNRRPKFLKVWERDREGNQTLWVEVKGTGQDFLERTDEYLPSVGCLCVMDYEADGFHGLRYNIVIPFLGNHSS